MSVLVEGDCVIVRGLFWSRRIRRADVVALKYFPFLALKWRRRSGGHVYTPLTALMSPMASLSSIKAHNDACVDRLAGVLRR